MKRYVCFLFIAMSETKQQELPQKKAKRPTKPLGPIYLRASEYMQSIERMQLNPKENI
jgi:hypothetical protein